MVDASVEASVAKIKSFGAGRAEITCNIESIKASRSLPKAYCRASFATIEAIIHTTRVKLFLSDGGRQKREQAYRLIELIEHYNIVVNRTAPNSRCSEIMAELTQRISSWESKS